MSRGPRKNLLGGGKGRQGEGGEGQVEVEEVGKGAEQGQGGWGRQAGAVMVEEQQMGARQEECERGGEE